MSLQSQRREIRYYGVRAVQAIFAKRPSDIIRAYVTQDTLKIFSPMLKYCASQKKAYHVVDSQALEKLTESVHHEGVAILALEKSFVSADHLPEASLMIYLDRVENPHNLGFILRTAAHFGVTHVMIPAFSQVKSLSPSTCRVAEGGAESVQVVSLERPFVDLRRLKESGYELIGTSSHSASKSLFGFAFPKKSILLLGNETHGISPDLMKLCDHLVEIPGTGVVESLNVSVACGVILSGWYGRHV